MHKRFLLALTLAVMGAGLLVAAAFAGSSAPAKAGTFRCRSSARASTVCHVWPGIASYMIR